MYIYVVMNKVAEGQPIYWFFNVLLMALSFIPSCNPASNVDEILVSPEDTVGFVSVC